MRPRPCERKASPEVAVPFVCVLLMVLALTPSCVTGPVHDDQRKGLAVWDIDDVSPAGSRLDISEPLSSRIIEAFRNGGEYTVVERMQLVRVLEELHIGASSLADEQTRLRIGRLVGARFMVFGGYQVVGGTMRLDLRLVEVETGKVLKAVKKTAPSNDISACLDAAGKAAAEF